ncbi:MAG: glycosyltransferase [Candidatus Woesearchaeota archaeon]
MKISFYPNSVLDWPNPFWRILKKELEKQDVKVIKMPFTFFDLLKNRNRVKVINFHYARPEVQGQLKKILPKKAWYLIYRFSCWFQKKTFRVKLNLAKKLGYKIIYTVHNLIPHNKNRNKINKYIKSLLDISDSIVTMGKSDKKKIEERYPDKKIDIIPHFHFKGSYKNNISKKEAKKRLNIPHKKFTYLFFGHLRKYKGIDKLIKIFKKTGLDAFLLIAGNSSQEPDYVDKLKRLSEEDNRIIIKDKKISYDKIQIYMNAADIVVFPFKQISNSGSLLLAKSFYKPTICMDKGNLKEYIKKDTDTLVKDDKELKKAVIRSMKTKFPKSKKEYLKGIPSPEEVAKEYLNVYKK